MEIELPSVPKDHSYCARWVKEGFALFDCDVTVSLAPPLVRTVFDLGPIICPHGVSFWHEPTGEQMMAWAQEHNETGQIAPPA